MRGFMSACWAATIEVADKKNYLGQLIAGMSFAIETLVDTLRCPGCQGVLSLDGHKPVHFTCPVCHERFPVTNDIPRMLLSPLREALSGESHASESDDRQVRTAQSFGYEWTRFPEMYAEWEQSFLNYMQPHAADFFRGKKVLDAGCGNGRFAYYAGK